MLRAVRAQSSSPRASSPARPRSASGTELGRGGMGSKVLAAQMASSAGIPTVIAAGDGDDVLGPILAGEERGTRFAPQERGESAFKLWLRFGKPVAGRLHVDEGARRALVETGASLLGVGVERCEGRFDPGAAVELVGPDGVGVRQGDRRRRRGGARRVARAASRRSTVTSWCSIEEGRGHRGRPRERACARGRPRRDRARGRRPDRLLRRPDLGPAAGGNVRARPRR